VHQAHQDPTRTFQIFLRGEFTRWTSCPSSLINSSPDVSLSRRPMADRKGRRLANLKWRGTSVVCYVSDTMWRLHKPCALLQTCSKAIWRNDMSLCTQWLQRTLSSACGNFKNKGQSWEWCERLQGPSPCFPQYKIFCHLPSSWTEVGHCWSPSWSPLTVFPWWRGRVVPRL